MKFERIRPGEYRAQLLRPGQFVWLVRDGRQWYWFQGGYDGYPDWDFGNGPFATRKLAIADVIATYR